MRFTYLPPSVFRPLHQRRLMPPSPTPSTRLSRPLFQNTRAFGTTNRLYSTSQDGDSSAADSDSQAMSDEEQKLFIKLKERFSNGKIAVQDVSGGCGQFFAIQVTHPDFAGLSTLKQHRLINQTLSDEIKSLHGLQIKTSAS